MRDAGIVMDFKVLDYYDGEKKLADTAKKALARARRSSMRQ